MWLVAVALDFTHVSHLASLGIFRGSSTVSRYLVILAVCSLPVFHAI